MKISSYNVQSSSSHKLEKSKEVAEKLEAWVGKRQNNRQEEPSFIIDFSSNKKIYKFDTEKSYLQSGQTDETKDQPSDVKLKLIESFIYMTTGKRVKLRSPELAALRKEDPSITDPDATMQQNADERDNWGLVYEYHEVTSESESIFFNSAGTVKTSDGTTISFELDFNMSRTFYQSYGVSVRMGNAKMDPLVMSLNGGAPKLTQSKQAFDLDADGTNENISFATGGSAFLALDKNNDGEINDGSELFGPDSGDGFEELRAYDLDKNGWIDENDAVFSNLMLYSLSEGGDKTLFKLGDAGIGAIYLNDISTIYDFKDNTGVSAGEMVSSSIFLKENGKAGAIHHIDLTI